MESPIVFSINTWWGLLQAALILFLLIATPAWLAYHRGYLQGSRKVLLWSEAMGHIPLGLALFGANRRSLFKNELATTLLNQLPADVIAHAYQVRGQSQRHATDVQVQQGEWISLQAWALGATNNGILFLLHDSTEEHAESQPAKESDRKFIRRVAHQMFTPLNLISSSLDAATGDRLTPEESQVHLHKAQKQLENLNRLTTNVRHLTRLDSDDPLYLQSYKILAVAREIAEQLYEKAVVHQMKLIVEPNPNLPPVEIDVMTWRQIFLNLMENSLKYGKPGGTVRVEVQDKVSELVISVADDGPGIPPEQIPSLFDEGSRGEKHKDVEGSGLGLTIVYLAVKRHKGQIWCESKLEQGTTFYITLPLDQ